MCIRDSSRLDGLQAAILSVKLKYIKQWTGLRIDRASYYSALLNDNPNIITPKIHSSSKHVFHLYVVQVKNRDKLQHHLKNNGIASAIHYPVPLPFMKAYEYLEYSPEDFPNIYATHQKILSLPMFPELSDDQIECIVDIINDFH